MLKYPLPVNFKALFVCLLLALCCSGSALAAGDQAAAPEGLRLAVFDVDATPPVGSRLMYDPMVNSWDQGLRAKGVVLLGAGQPIVLVSVDWIGIANESQDAFKQALARAAGTAPERVAVHAIHQHDAPIADFGSEKIFKDAGMDPISFEGTFARQLIGRLEEGVKLALTKTQPLTHLGLGQAAVKEVASNRRIIGPDGKSRAQRTSATKDPKLRAEPEGTIDPMVSLVSFWNGAQPLAVLSYYAVHPQSYYRTGVANPDFPGIARFMRQMAVPKALHVHFNGAGGNLTAGKYNDGAWENRLLLAERLAAGMKKAWEATQKEPLTPESISWAVEPVALPAKPELEKLAGMIKTKDATFLANNITKLAWVRRLKAGKKIDVSCLSLGRARILHLPGELFVEYQLAAKAERPDLFVAMAAYGDYGPGYIGTAAAYQEGGYEAEQASAVTAESEKVLMTAIRKLLQLDLDEVSIKPKKKPKK